MKILFAAPYTPSKIRPRPFYLIKGLKERGHSVTFVGLIDDYTWLEKEREFEKYLEHVKLFRIPMIKSYLNCLLNLCTNLPLQAAYSYSREMKEYVQELCLENDFDIIHIEHLRAAYCLPEKRSIPALYDSVDCISNLYLQFKEKAPTVFRKAINQIEYRKLKKYEPYLLTRFDGITAVTQQEIESLMNLIPQDTEKLPVTAVVANGVDSSYFSPENSSVEPYSIVFVGKMGYYANEIAAVHFAREIFPEIKAKQEKAKFYIVGANPPKKVRELARIKGIVVTGWVPDTKVFLRRAHVVVCPLSVAVGIQNKILEAMAMAKAVVSYPSPVSSLKQSKKAALVISETERDFTDQVLGLMNDDVLRNDVEKNARTYVLENYSWHDSIERLEKFYKKLIGMSQTEAAK
jgi:sugar transferase (PEP-CTERM/EpsH1 system associated)